MTDPKESLWKNFPAPLFTTGIGSLPHPDVDSALQHSFSFDLPFLPQIPIRNPKEFMVYQAIDQLPGLVLEEGGMVSIDIAKWEKGTGALRERTEAAFASDSLDAFESFLPSPDVWHCWKPFLFEIQERNCPAAKLQIAGPMTCQWAMAFLGETTTEIKTEIVMQAFRLVLARCIAMIREIERRGVTPLLFLDEPGFYGFSVENPRHRMALEELKLFVRTLKKENALVGIHCCSNTEWSSILSLPVDVLSIDAQLSLSDLLSSNAGVESFVARGGRISLGAVPTGMHSLKIQSLESKIIVESLWKDLCAGKGNAPSWVKDAILTPACGLALHTIEDAETILALTQQVSEDLQARIV